MMREFGNVGRGEGFQMCPLRSSEAGEENESG